MRAVETSIHAGQCACLGNVTPVWEVVPKEPTASSDARWRG